MYCYDTAGNQKDYYFQKINGSFQKGLLFLRIGANTRTYSVVYHPLVFLLVPDVLDDLNC